MNDTQPGNPEFRTSAKPGFFGARKEVERLEASNAELASQLQRLGAMEVVQLESRRAQLEREIADREAQAAAEARAAAHAAQLQAQAVQSQISAAQSELSRLNTQVVVTNDTALLQEAGVYEYRHPLTDVVAYEQVLTDLKNHIKAWNRADGGAVQAISDWMVNGSAAQGKKMVRDFSKLMLRAFNAEADNLVRGLKPYKLDRAVERLTKVAETIARLGATMQIRIANDYLALRIRELEWTADYRNKQAEEKEREREDRARLREEKKVQQEIERERERLAKERTHIENALAALRESGDQEAIDRMEAQLEDVEKAVQDVDYRAANVRAGYVYVVSNIGSFGEQTVKIGMTRRLDPMDRIRELSDASVPFNFDIHAIHFSEDAFGIEAELHRRFADQRVNTVNRRREFFRVTPHQVKLQFASLAGELLHFEEVPEAIEYRQSKRDGEMNLSAISNSARSLEESGCVDGSEIADISIAASGPAGVVGA